MEPESSGTEKFTVGSKGGAGEAGHHTLDINAHYATAGEEDARNFSSASHGFETLFTNETGEKLSATDIFESDKWSANIFQDTKTISRTFILNLTNIIEPDYFVLGGGLSNSPHIYEGLQQKIDELHFLKGEPAPKVLKHQLGDSAGVIGAALLV